MSIRATELVSGRRPFEAQSRPRGTGRALLRGIVLNLGLLIGMFFCSPSFAGCSGSSPTWTAGSASQTDVQACVTAASSGDTILVPAGTVSFSAAVTIPSTKCLTINGQNGVTITNAPAFVLNQSNSCESRITGFTFTGTSGNEPNVDIWVLGGTSASRIDNNTFTAAGTNIFIEVYDIGSGGQSYPLLIDHNTFNCGYQSGSACEAIHNEGATCCSEVGWTNNVTPGGPNMVFIEDNTFNQTGGNGGNVISALESFYGAQTVFRHNTLNYSAQVDQHGTASYVGARWWEIYDNQFNSKGYNQCCFITVRGGTGVIWGNQTDGTSTSSSGSTFINLYNENGSTSSWPNEWQIGSGMNGYTNGHNSCPGPLNSAPAYVWGNAEFLEVGSGGGASGTVLLGRDYFSSASQPATMNWWEQSTDSCSTTYSYTPYTYPHPLQGQGTTVAAPSGLAAVVQP